MINIGEQIREIRMRRGYNQEQLAEMANLNRVTIAKYESGKVEPGAQAIARMADALEVSTDELLGRHVEEDRQLETETMAIRERLRRDPSYRILFSAADTAAPEHLRAAAAMLKALEPEEGADGA